MVHVPLSVSTVAGASTADAAADFSNLPLDTTSLPALQDLPLQPLAPAHKWLNLGISLLCCLPSLVFCVIAQYQLWFSAEEIYPPLPWISLSLPLLLTFLPLWRFAADRRKAYALRQQDLSLRSGLLIHRLVVQPILRVQHVELKRGPLERRFDLATLKLFNATGSLAIILPGLPVEQAAGMRQFIIDHGDLSTNA